MYDAIPYIIAIIFILLGGFMSIMPAKSVKKEFKNSEEHIKKTRRNGIIILILAILLLVVSLILR